MISSPYEVERVRALVDAERPVADDPPSTIGWLQRMCRVAARELSAEDVGVTLISSAGMVLTAAASGPRGVALEDLQFTLGEGPCLAAYSSRRPVLVPDLASAAVPWREYAAAARDQAVGAVFAFPLQVGLQRVGAMDVYRDAPGPLTDGSMSRAVTFAETALDGLLRARESASSADALVDISATRFEVYQAQGMVMAQLGVGADEALLRIRAHAFVSEQALADVSREILTGRVRLEPDELP